MTGRQFQSPTDARAFIEAGHATVTAVSVASGVRFTYRIRASDDGKVFFVGVLSGPDNESSYTYLGIIRDGVFRRTGKSAISEVAPSHQAFRWMYKKLTYEQLPDSIEIWHEGRCGRCGLKLTVPESIQSGYGPECIKIIRRESHPQLALVG